MLRCRGNVAHVHAELSKRIDHCGSRSVHWKLAQPLGAEWAAGIWILHHHDIYFRHIERSWNHVIGELSVRHRTIPHNNFFEKRVAESLCSSAFDLPARERRMDRPTEFLDSRDLDGLHFKRVGIERE